MKGLKGSFFLESKKISRRCGILENAEQRNRKCPHVITQYHEVWKNSAGGEKVVIFVSAKFFVETFSIKRL